MPSRIVLVIPADVHDLARNMTPPGFDLTIAAPRTPEYQGALAEAEYLVGFVDMLVNDALYRAAPNLKLIPVSYTHLTLPTKA